MESVGRLAGGIAHDFNNMLGVIIGHAAMALMETSPTQPMYEHLREINNAAERSAELTRQLLAFARKQKVAPKILDLNLTISGTLKMLQRLIGEGIGLEWRPAPELWPVKMDPSQIDQILANLCINARDAIDLSGRIVIETGTATIDREFCRACPDAAPGDYVWISVSDDGRGMDKETLAHIYEPFFTTKGIGEGTGLGLATVYGAVKQNDGFIFGESSPNHGTTFTIHIPSHKGEDVKASKADQSMPLPRGNETILLVEDEPSIQKVAAAFLSKQGYHVLSAGSTIDALRLARDNHIDLLLTDVIMPVMNGSALAGDLQQVQPHMRTLFMSGYTADVISTYGVFKESSHFIQKPFPLPDLAMKVREILDCAAV